MKRICLSVFCILFFILPSNSQENIDSLKKWKFDFNANVDLAYSYNQNKNISLSAPNLNHDGLTLGWLNTAFNLSNHKWEFAVDLVYGDRATSFYPYDGEIGSLINQLYFSYNVNKKLKFTAGNITTPFNNEWNSPYYNFTFSNSLVYYIIQASYTGVFADYVLSDKWKMKLGVTMDSGRKWEPKSKPHLLTSFNRESDKLSFTTDFIVGEDGDSTVLWMADAYATYKFSDKFELGSLVHLAYNQPKIGEDGHWFGANIFSKYSLKSWMDLGVRFEYLIDAQGAGFGLVDNFSTKEATFTTKFKYKNFALVPEVRISLSDQPIFLDNSELGINNRENLFVLGLIYNFE
jgi:hypothetical protein